MPLSARFEAGRNQKGTGIAGRDGTLFSEDDAPVPNSTADLRHAYIRARTVRVDVWAEEMIEIPDAAVDPRKAAVQVSTRQWVMARINHDQWGDKRDINTNFRAEIDAMTPQQQDEQRRPSCASWRSSLRLRPRSRRNRPGSGVILQVIR